MSTINRSKMASRSAPAAEQIAAREDSTQKAGAEARKSLVVAKNGQPRRGKAGSGQAADGNDTLVDTDAANLTASTPAVSTRPKKVSKQDLVLELLRQTEGATIDELMEATAWQVHSVRGFLSGTVRKKLKLDLMSDVVGNGVRRYRVVSRDQAGRSGEAADQPAAEGTQGA